jgi:hypothetical protein
VALAEVFPNGNVYLDGVDSVEEKDGVGARLYGLKWN